MLTSEIKLGIVALLLTLSGYGFYKLVIEPRNTINGLQVEVQKKNNKATEIVTNINKKDANTTQGKINEVKKDKTIIINDSGSIIFK